MYTTDPGRMTGSIWHRRSRPRRAGRATASNLDTHLDRGFGRKVRMLLSFQRPSHLFGRGFLPGARPKPSPIPERTGEYSARIAARCGLAVAIMAHPSSPTLASLWGAGARYRFVGGGRGFREAPQRDIQLGKH